jgi:hypothetical protein
VLFVTGRSQANWTKNLSDSVFTTYKNSYNAYKGSKIEFPLYLNPPSLDEWDTYFKNKLDDQTNKVGHPTTGKPYSQPKVKIKISSSSGGNMEDGNNNKYDPGGGNKQ